MKQLTIQNMKVGQLIMVARNPLPKWPIGMKARITSINLDDRGIQVTSVDDNAMYLGYFGFNDIGDFDIVEEPYIVATRDNICPGTMLCSMRNASSFWYRGKVIRVERIVGNWVYFTADGMIGEDSFSTDGIGDFDIIDQKQEIQSGHFREIMMTRNRIKQLEDELVIQKENLDILIKADEIAQRMKDAG